MDKLIRIKTAVSPWVDKKDTQATVTPQILVGDIVVWQGVPTIMTNRDHSETYYEAVNNAEEIARNRLATRLKQLLNDNC